MKTVNRIQFSDSTGAVCFSASQVRILSVMLIAVLMSPVTPLFAQSDKPDCQCRAPGGVMRNLGTVECVDVVGHRYLVVCEMSTNTPYWKKLEGSDDCPSA